MWKVDGLTIALVLISGGHANAQKTPAVGLNFTSAAYGDLGHFLGQSACAVPDTMGAVGPNHIVQLINGLYTVVDITDDSIEVLHTTLDTFWANAGVVPQNSDPEGTEDYCTTAFDPRVVYDPYQERFYAVSVDDGLHLNNFLVAVSKTSNPLDGWTGFPVKSDSGDTRWADFPRLGMSRDYLVISGVMTLVQGQGVYQDETVVVIRKDQLLADEASVGTPVFFEEVRSTTGIRPHPVFSLDNDATDPTLLSGNEDFVRLTTISGTPLSLSDQTFTLDDSSYAPGGRQPNSVRALSNTDGRFSAYPVLQNGVFWGTHVIKHPDDETSAVRWIGIDEQSNGKKEGLVSSSSKDYLYPSIAVNKVGDVVMGFTGTWTDTFASSTAVVGEVDANEITISTTLVPKAGNDTLEIIPSPDPNRWGDYSATVVDPINPLHFWTFQEFVLDEDVWGIQISQIKLTPDDVLGDMDFDGDLDLDDIGPFLLALSEPDNYYDIFGGKDFVHGDVDQDGEMDLDDVDHFVSALVSGGGSGSGSRRAFGRDNVHAIPEPSGILLLSIALVSMSASLFRRLPTHESGRTGIAQKSEEIS